MGGAGCLFNFFEFILVGTSLTASMHDIEVINVNEDDITDIRETTPISDNARKFINLILIIILYSYLNLLIFYYVLLFIK